MKKCLFLVPLLACATLLLSGCPDAKLPTPTPMVPTPKAQHTADHGRPAVMAGQPLSAAMSVKAGDS